MRSFLFDLLLSFFQTKLTENTVYFDAGSGRKEAIPPFSPRHARRLENIHGIVVMEGILTWWVIPVYGNALKTVDGKC